MEDPNSSKAAQTLMDLMTHHGLSCGMHAQWVVPNGELPAIRALWQQLETSGRLDIQVVLERGRYIEECFAGVGTGPAAFADAFNNFMVNSLHVLLSSLWGICDERHVTHERWHVGGRHFTAYVGGIGKRTSAGIRVDPPPDLFDIVERSICQESLAGDIHWFRFFFGNLSGQHTYEALRDNEPWEAGIAALNEIAWPKADGYYSFRNFIVLRAE